MSRLFKPTYTKPDRETGKRVKQKTKKWYGEYVDENGLMQRVPLSTDKSAAQSLLNDLLKRVERRRAGLEDSVTDASRVSIDEHLSEFAKSLKAKGNSAKHLSVTESRVRTVFSECKAQRVAELTAGKVESYLVESLALGMSPRTANYYLAALKQFGKWLVRTRRLHSSPWEHLSAMRTSVDVRRKRRAATQEELECLLRAAESGTRFLLDGPDRAMLYLVAMQTGLRASELASLTPRSLDLTLGTAAVTVEAAYSKRRKRDVQPLPDSLVERLGDWLVSKALQPSDKLWPGGWPNKAAKMLRHDLAVAEIEYMDSEGRQFDFHSLRHTFISRLAEAGVSPKTAQRLARHSTITLTMDRYTHVEQPQLTDAVQKLTDVRPSVRPVGEVIESTAEPEKLVVQLVVPVVGECPEVSTAGLTGNGLGQQNTTPNPPSDSELGVCCPRLASADAKRLRPDSNRGWWICNPLP